MQCALQTLSFINALNITLYSSKHYYLEYRHNVDTQISTDSKRESAFSSGIVAASMARLPYLGHEGPSQYPKDASHDRQLSSTDGKCVPQRCYEDLTWECCRCGHSNSMKVYNCSGLANRQTCRHRRCGTLFRRYRGEDLLGLIDD